MEKANTVGELRNQCAFQDADTPIVLVTKNADIGRLIQGLKVVRVYPDTTDGSGNWASTLKIEVDKQ